MLPKSALLKGTFILTFVGFLTRIMGFFYRIFLSRMFTAEEIGFYQLIFPIYALGFSFSAAGIQTALSRCTARYFAQNKKEHAIHIFKSALALSIILSFFVMILIQKNAVYISEVFLGSSSTQILLTVMTYAFPFAAIHSCICGYYLGQKSIRVVAVSQLIEQTFRILAVYLFFYLMINRGNSPSILIAVFGLIIGEISASFYSLFQCRRELFSTKSTWKDCLPATTSLLRSSVPLTANRVLLNLMQSVESISIPLMLQSYGMDSSTALSIYGVFSGMALPCILFPSAITNALSSMLLPTIAEYQVSRSKKELKHYALQIAGTCFLMGCACFLIFLLTGNYMGSLIFHNSQAGSYIVTLSFLCPFLYMNTTLLTILNGLGCTTATFFINIFSLALRILSVFFAIPQFGFGGYLIGLLTSQIVVTILTILHLNQILL